MLFSDKNIACEYIRRKFIMKYIPVRLTYTSSILKQHNTKWKDHTNANTTTVTRSSQPASLWDATFQLMPQQSNTFAWFAWKSSHLGNTWKSTPTSTQVKSLSSVPSLAATKPSDKLASSLFIRNFTKTKYS